MLSKTLSIPAIIRRCLLSWFFRIPEIPLALCNLVQFFFLEKSGFFFVSPSQSLTDQRSLRGEPMMLLNAWQSDSDTNWTESKNELSSHCWDFAEFDSERMSVCHWRKYFCLKLIQFAFKSNIGINTQQCKTWKIPFIHHYINIHEYRSILAHSTFK